MKLARSVYRFLTIVFLPLSICVVVYIGLQLSVIASFSRSRILHDNSIETRNYVNIIIHSKDSFATVYSTSKIQSRIIQATKSPQMSSSVKNVLTTRKTYTKEIVDIGNQTSARGVGLITMFSSWSSNDNHSTVREITLRNWGMLKPKVIPVYFRNGLTPNVVTQYGWQSLPVAQTAAGGIPVLKAMYVETMKIYKSQFYAFSNGDILFNEGLTSTLQIIIEQGKNLPRPILIIGRRTNVFNVTKTESGTLEGLTRAAKARGNLYGPEAIDYFITDITYPWSDIPGFVIGRQGYDNWLVYNSLKQRHTVIDATETILALHQTTEAGNHEGKKRMKGYYNNKMIRKMFPNVTMGSGRTWCAPWVTKFDRKDRTRLYLKPRYHFAKTC